MAALPDQQFTCPVCESHTFTERETEGVTSGLCIGDGTCGLSVHTVAGQKAFKRCYFTWERTAEEDAKVFGPVAP